MNDTDEEIRDTKGAFRPCSPYFGSLLGPVALVIPAERCCPDCQRPLIECRCGGGEMFINDFPLGCLS